MVDHARQDVRLLVCIASYGTANDVYLSRLLREYRSLPYSTSIVVLSNIPKDLGADVEVIAGLPTKDPWSLPFGHKELFAKRRNDYDLFLYSEDDILITQRNIEAFRSQTTALQEDEIAGFVRFETDSAGAKFFPELHLNYHWAPNSVTIRGGHMFAFLTNEHSACYILTHQQLTKAIASGNYLVQPHQGKYDLLVTAATDPYTQCGLRKLVCISDIESVLVHHLSNKYVGRYSLPSGDFYTQIGALLTVGEGQQNPPSLWDGYDSRLRTRHGKNYYEGIREDIINLIPAECKTVLSIGCGLGLTEQELIARGKSVVAVPADVVFSACASSRNIKVVGSSLDEALGRLRHEKFDCILALGALHMMPDPANALVSVSRLLRNKGRFILTVPNLASIPSFLKRVRAGSARLRSYAESGVHPVSHRQVRKWLRGAGLEVELFADVLPNRIAGNWRKRLQVAAPVLSSEIVAIGMLN
jgi:SAM-dependent methyltransferase